MSWASRITTSGSLALLATGMTAPAASAAIVFSADGENVGENATPTPTVGTWGLVTTKTRVAGVGTNSVGVATPASPNGGANIMIVDRPASNVGRNNFGTFSTPATNVGDTVRVSFDAFSQQSLLSIGLTSSTDTGATPANGFNLSVLAYINGTTSGGAGTVSSLNRTANPDVNSTLPGVGHTGMQWQSYILEYVIGDSFYKITTGANTYTTTFLSTESASLSRVEGFFINGGGSTSVGYFDNVIAEVIPEPGSVATLFAGLGLMALRRCRK